MEAASRGHFRLAGREYPKVTWWREPEMRKVYFILMFVVLTSATNGYDSSMVNGLLALGQFNSYFHNPTGTMVGLFSSILFLGGVVAQPVVPYLADNFGRRVAIFSGAVLMILGVALQAASFNLHMFIAGRFLVGFGVAIAHVASPLLIAELVHPQHRATFTTVYNTTWYIGSIVAAWLTFGTNNIMNQWSWRIPSMAQAAPPILQLCFVWFVPESPRWYISKGKEEVALRVLAKVHANGNANDELVQVEFEEIKSTLKLEAESNSNGWAELWRTKGNRRRLLILATLGLFSQWSGNGLVSYYMSSVLASVGITDSNKQLVINGVLQIANACVAVGSCFVVDRIGRRKLFLGSTAGMLVCFVVWTVLSARLELGNGGNRGMGNAVVLMIFLYYVCYNTAWSGLMVGYAVEILPFNIRAKGIAVLWFGIDASLFVSTFVNSLALDALHWKYYIVYCVWLAIELAVVYCFYVETRNTPLEEISKHFDGEDAVVGGTAATEEGRALAQEIGLVVEKKGDAVVIVQKEV
ncbi:general substrate transporter [Phyllosticta capitalensis]|uniref:MFS transporter n=1 Tax=Phyllosticta capitalensis TaxID=121624 RepID=UPI00312FF802